MPFKSKTSRREHSSETKTIVLTLKSLEKSHQQIANHLKLFKLIVIIMLRPRGTTNDNTAAPWRYQMRGSELSDFLSITKVEP